MKNIVRTCHSHYGKSPQRKVKIRLRGRGSGHLEGPMQRESREPMQVCVSGKYQPSFELACKMVERLLLDISEDWAKYISKKGFPFRSQEISFRKRLVLSEPYSSVIQVNTGPMNCIPQIMTPQFYQPWNDMSLQNETF